MRDAETFQEARFLTSRLCRANTARHVEPEIVDPLLRALRLLVDGREPQSTPLVSAALEAIGRQNALTREVLDENERRAMELCVDTTAPPVPKRPKSTPRCATARAARVKRG